MWHKSPCDVVIDTNGEKRPAPARANLTGEKIVIAEGHKNRLLLMGKVPYKDIVNGAAEAHAASASELSQAPEAAKKPEPLPADPPEKTAAPPEVISYEDDTSKRLMSKNI